MNNLRWLLFLILCISEIRALELEKPLKVPIEIENNSDYGVTIIFAHDRASLEFDILAARLLTNMVGKLPAVIEYGTTFRIITSKGHFATEYGDPILFKHVYDKGGACRDVCHPKIPLAGLQKIYATIHSDGEISLLAKKSRPFDFRPDVSLAIYGKLTGEQSYTSPEKILGITGHKNVQQACQEKLKEWDLEKHPSNKGEAFDALRLITWAAEKLVA